MIEMKHSTPPCQRSRPPSPCITFQEPILCLTNSCEDEGVGMKGLGSQIS